MASEITRPAYRGLGIPDLQLNADGAIWRAQVTTTVEGGQPGRPVAQNDTDLVLYANGERQSASDLHVRAARAGSIDPDGANFVWKLAGDPYWRARIPPHSIWGWDAPVYTDGTGTGVTSCKHPFVLALDDGTLLVANEQIKTVGALPIRQVAVRRRTAAAATYSEAVVYFRPGSHATANDHQCCMVAVPRGAGQRVYLFFWWQDIDALNANVRAYYSDDSGSSWTLASRGVLPEDIVFSPANYEGFRLRAAYRRGQMVLFVGLRGQESNAGYFRDHIRQYAAAGASLSFVLVASSQGLANYEGRFFDVVASKDAFVLGYVNQLSVSINRNTVFIRLDDAFLPFTSVGFTESKVGSVDFGTAALDPVDSLLTLRTFNGPQEDAAQVVVASGSKYMVTDGDLALCVHDDRSLYLYRRSVSDPTIGTVGKNEVHVFHSLDNGRVWRPLGTSDACIVGNELFDHQCATVWQSQDAESHPYRLSATSWRGRVVLCHQWQANPGNEDNSVGLMYLGGYCNIAMPRTALAPKPEHIAPWVLTWLPIERPSDTSGYAGFGAGGDVLDTSKAALNVSCSAQMRRFRNTDATGPIRGHIVRAVVKVNSAAVLITSQTGIRLQAFNAAAATSYAVQLRFSTGGMRLHDEVASASIGSDVTVDMTAGVDLVLAVQDGKAQLWYRAMTNNDDLAYTLGADGAVADGGSSLTADEVDWGVFASDTSDVDWFEFHMTRDEFTGGKVQSMPDMSNPADLVGVPYARDGVYVTDGVRVFASRGPALEGDEHVIGQVGQYDVRRLLVTMQPSPRDFWRSKDDDSEHIIALSYEHGARAGLANTHAMSDAQYAVIDNMNFRTFYIEGYDAGSSSWTTVVDGDAAISFVRPFSWSLSGSRLKALGTGIGPYLQMYLEPDELVGWTVEMVGATTTLRRITANTEGNTDGSLAGRKAVLVFDGADGTESNTSRTRLWSNSMLVRWNLLGAKYAAYRIRIPAQDTVDGYFKIGSLHIGDIAVFGSDYSWGRQQSSEHGSEIVESEDRTHIVTQRAPVRRTVSIDWSDGVDTTNVSGAAPDPDYIRLSSSAGAEAVASTRDVPFLLDGLYRRTNGPATCVVYIPRLVPGPPDTEQLRRKGRDFLVGYIDGSVDRSSELGDENIDEVFRVGRISISEVV